MVEKAKEELQRVLELLDSEKKEELREALLSAINTLSFLHQELGNDVQENRYKQVS